jgi:putative hydrolase of the HAD superfamily
MENPQPQVVFFDVGGVLGTNGWDRATRQRAASEFGFDWEEFQDRHDFVSHDFEIGRLDIDQYLDRTLFYRQRSFGPDAFMAFMKAQSEPFPDSLEVVADLAASKTAVLATLNNESRELNDHRIRLFGLDDHFSMFLSSCYLGVSKPEPEIYRMAADITQRQPEECLFIDDRQLNLECATREGMQTHLFTTSASLRAQLGDLGLLTN